MVYRIKARRKMAKRSASGTETGVTRPAPLRGDSSTPFGVAGDPSSGSSGSCSASDLEGPTSRPTAASIEGRRLRSSTRLQACCMHNGCGSATATGATAGAFADGRGETTENRVRAANAKSAFSVSAEGGERRCWPELNRPAPEKLQLPAASRSSDTS